MEVASLVIGVASLAGVAETVEKTIRTIHEVYEAPEAYQALLNEVTAFKTFLHDVEGAVTGSGASATESFRVSILRARECLSLINCALERCMNGSAKVKRLRWAIKIKSLNTYTQNLRNARLEIIGALSIISQTATIQASANQQFNATQNYMDQIRTSSTVLNAAIRETRVMTLDPNDQLELHRLSGPTCAPEDALASLSDPQQDHNTGANSNYTMLRKENPPQQAGEIRRFYTVCGCMCHKTYRFATPLFLLNYLGAVFIAHSGLPVVARECGDVHCQHPAAPFGSLTWCLPSWLLNVVITCIITNSTRPQLILRLSKVVPAGDNIFQHVQDGSLSDLRMLFARKEASPYDITATRGQTALQLAVLLNKLEICEFLLTENADPYLEDWEESCTFDVAWDSILGKMVDKDSRQRLREMFSNTTGLEKLGFSKLHKVVLELVVLDLKEELTISSNMAINKQDEQGKTPLAWAALRGDYNSAKLLLEYGSNVKISTPRGFTPLHFAAQSGSISTVRHILQRGADVNARNTRQESPLHLAARHHDRPELLKLLLNFKLEQNCRAQFGYTPLIYAVQEDHVQSVAFLLGSDADINAQDHRGFTALSFAIFLNRHKCMACLLQYSADQTVISKRGRSLLHLVAMYADLVSMRILLKYLSPKLPPRLHKCDRGFTAIDLAISRRSETCEEWKNGFLTLDRGVRSTELTQ